MVLVAKCTPEQHQDHVSLLVKAQMVVSQINTFFSITCNHSARIWLTNEGGKSHKEVTIIIIATNMILMFVDFQADANPVQVLCTPSQWGKQCLLTYSVAHIREEFSVIQSRGMTGDEFDWEGSCCKHYFQIPNDCSDRSFIPLHYIL